MTLHLIIQLALSKSMFDIINYFLVYSRLCITLMILNHNDKVIFIVKDSYGNN